MRQIVPVYVATRARTRGVHERLAPERERGPPFAHASKCVNGHSPFTHGWGLLHPFAHGDPRARTGIPVRARGFTRRARVAAHLCTPGCSRRGSRSRTGSSGARTVIAPFAILLSRARGALSVWHHAFCGVRAHSPQRRRARSYHACRGVRRMRAHPRGTAGLRGCPHINTAVPDKARALHHRTAKCQWNGCKSTLKNRVTPTGGTR